MINDYFNYSEVTESDVRLYGAIPNTIKITAIIKPDDKGTVNIPSEIDGIPVTFYDASGYYGPLITKLIIPETLVSCTSCEYFPSVESELVISEENPKWSTDGSSLLSKDGTSLLRMCMKQKSTYSVPQGVTTICHNAFKFCNLIEICFPDSVRKIGSNAFQFCHSLETIRGGNGIQEYDFSSFRDTKWFKNAKDLILGKILVRADPSNENAVVPEGVEIIGSAAFNFDFEKQRMLETVRLPSTLKVIGSYAFSGNKNLKSISLPEGLTDIHKNAFSGCEALAEVNLPASLKKIGQGVFRDCASLETVHFADDMSKFFGKCVINDWEENLLSDEVFRNCKTLKSINLPTEIRIIGQKVFENCSSLNQIKLPDSLEEIEAEAFSCCTSIESITITEGLRVIKSDALPRSKLSMFGKTTSCLCSLQVDEKNENFSSMDGILYSKDGKTLIMCPARYNATEYTIPEAVRVISDRAFRGCENIKKLIIPDTVTEIGKEAFSFMESLEEVSLPKNMTELNEGLFWHDKSLKHIIWPDDLHKIGKKCFAEAGLDEVYIPSTVEEIDDYAFMKIKAKTVTLPKKVKNIGYSIFAGISDIEIYDTIDQAARPAGDYSDPDNGSENGRAGFIGIYQRENYVCAACNSDWYEHSITVHSAADDRVKFRLRMPAGQKRKVYCTFASSWGKNGEFNFAAADELFKDMTADAKEDYFLCRLKYTKLDEAFEKGAANYVSRNAKALCEKIMASDDALLLEKTEPYGMVKKSTIEERLQQANTYAAVSCKVWLLEWQNKNASQTKQKKESSSLSLKAPTVAELKKIWPHKKGEDGIIITGYNGIDTDVTVPEVIGKTPVVAIGDNCFCNGKDEETRIFLRNHLRSVYIPDSVRTIGGMAFYHCEALEKVVLPANLKEMSDFLFAGCKKISVNIPKGIETLGLCVFNNCTADVMHIPASVSSISEASFGMRSINFVGIPTLKAFSVDAANKNYCDEDGVLFNKDKSILIRYPQSKSDEEYTVPESVTRIADNAFMLCSKLKRVNLPNTIKEIGGNAFWKCSALESINLPSKIKELKDSFACCESLQEFTVPKGIKTLPDSMFWTCKKLKKVTLPEGLTKIGYSAFSGCESLTSVNIPKSVRGIGGSAFEGCKSLEKLTICNAVTGLGFALFRGCDNLTVYASPDSKIYAYAKNNNVPVEALKEDE